VQICGRHIDVELRAAQRHDELTSERVALDAQLTELHHRKATLEMERATSIDFTKARAQARAVTTAVDHEGPQASQNVVAAATLLDTLPMPSIDGVDKVYHQLKDILDVATTQ
jgi:hypothetical protein